MRLPRAFSSLRNYNFRLFWFGQLISLIGTWVQTVAQAWLVLELTNSPLALGTVTALQFLPVLLLALFAGVFVDRLAKRRLLLLTQTTAMLLALVLGVLVSTHLVQLWHIYVLATLLGLVNAFDNPARQAFVIEMVGRGEVVNAVALNSMLFNGARIVGPAIGGFLIASVGLAECFYVNGISFLGAIAALLLMREHLLLVPGRRAGGRVLAELAEGLRYARHTPPVFLIVILMAVIGTFGYNFNTIMPLLARNVLGQGAEGFGGLLSVMGIGSLVAALFLATYQRTTPRRLFFGAAGLTVLLGLVALSRSYGLSLVLMLPLGFVAITFTTTANSLLQLEVPDYLRGRLMSLYTLLFLGSTPIGGEITGFLAEQVGVQWTMAIEALICAGGIVAGLAYYRTAGVSAAERSSIAGQTGDARRSQGPAMREARGGAVDEEQANDRREL